MLIAVAASLHFLPIVSKLAQFGTVEKERTMPATMLKEETPSKSILEHLEDEERWASSRRRHRLLTAVVIILAAAIAAAAWYAYPLLRNQGVLMTKFSGIGSIVNTMGNDIKNANSKLADLSKNHDELQARMDKLSSDVRARLDAAKKQTSDATAALMSRVESEVDSQTSALGLRLANLESSRASEQDRIGGLQQELDRVRADVARQSEELAAARRQMNSTNAATEHQLADLQLGERRDRSDVDQIANSLAVESVRFEASKGRMQELATGISLKLTGTDVANRRVNGWMWLTSDRRTIWLRGQGVQQPVIFYGLEDGKKRELVITQVTKDSVTGYLIVPKAASASPEASSD